MTDTNSENPSGPRRMEAEGEVSKMGSPPPPRTGIGARLRNYLIAGILVTAPISVTFYLSFLFIDFVDRWVAQFIPQAYSNFNLPFSIPGLGLLAVIAVLIAIGALTAGMFGRMWMRFSEHILRRMPIVRGIYSAIKQILETVLSQQSNAFREAVLIEYPRRGLWSIGFITGSTKGEVQTVTQEEVVTVFLPTTPNPTSGFLLFVPRRELIHLKMPVEDAIKMVISGGIVTPPEHPPRTPALPASGEGGIAKRTEPAPR